MLKLGCYPWLPPLAPFGSYPRAIPGNWGSNGLLPRAEQFWRHFSIVQVTGALAVFVPEQWEVPPLGSLLASVSLITTFWKQEPPFLLSGLLRA